MGMGVRTLAGKKGFLEEDEEEGVWLSQTRDEKFGMDWCVAPGGAVVVAGKPPVFASCC